VTGAAGYVGIRVVEVLAARSMKCTAVVHPNDPPERVKRLRALPNVEVLVEDILELKDDAFLRLGSPEVCIHLAWKSGFNHSDRVHLDNALRHFNFLSSLTAGGLRHLSVAGTAHEIGFFEGRIDETTPCNPLNFYGVAKNFLRQSLFASMANSTVTLQWLRFFYIYGHDLENQSIFTKLLQAETSGQPTFGLNHGEMLYDFIHVETLAEQIVAAISQREVQGIINCCTGKPVTLRNQVLRFVAEHKLSIKLEWGKFPLRPYDSYALWGDASRINSILSHSAVKG
jgi:nucleoside-diphosphate-sugar epimerase